ncbi:MAG: hypothetical protein ACOCOD_06140 [Prevotella sp.]
MASAASSCGIRRIVVWHSPHRRVAFAASSCGIRRIIVWHSPQHRVAFAMVNMLVISLCLLMPR